MSTCSRRTKVDVNVNTRFADHKVNDTHRYFPGIGVTLESDPSDADRDVDDELLWTDPLGLDRADHEISDIRFNGGFTS